MFRLYLTDFLNSILDAMYIEELKGNAQNSECANKREEILSQQRKPGWVFNGFMAFAMFGPLAIDAPFKSKNIMKGILCLFNIVSQ